MRKTIQLSTIAFLIMLIGMPINANAKELKSILNEKELKRISSAESLIAKGDAIIKESEDLKAEVEKLKNADGRIKTGKINKRNKQISEKKVKASLYYNDGYKKYIDVLDDRLKELEKAGNSSAKQTRDDIKDLEKKARKQYNKAKNLTSAENMVELIELAQENQNKAIELQSKYLLSFTDEIEDEPAPFLVAEQVVEDTISTEVTVPVELSETTTSISNDIVEVGTAAASNPNMATTVGIAGVGTAALATELDANSTAINEVGDQAPPQELIIKEEVAPVSEAIEEPIIAMPPTNLDVYLTIQFMADRKKATEEQIASIYNGRGEIIEMNVNDWYKYSVGKYQNLEDAKADMSAEKIKGFIVAYNKKQRISVKEALTLLNGES